MKRRSWSFFSVYFYSEAKDLLLLTGKSKITHNSTMLYLHIALDIVYKYLLSSFTLSNTSVVASRIGVIISRLNMMKFRP